MIEGVDVSNYNGAYPWTGGERLGFAKATEGTFFKDPWFPHNWNTMWARHILRGAYHFGHPGTSATEQAHFFVAYVKAHGLEKFDALALDLEVTDGRTPAEVAAWAVEFVSLVEKLTGKNVWVYTDGAFITGGYCAGLYKHPLWVASPGNEPGHPSVSLGQWKVWVLHQYAFGEGGAPDRDVLNGDADVWEALVNLTPAVTYKTVTGRWDCEGMSSLTELCAGRFNNTAVPGISASTVLRLTLDNSHDQLFASDLARYISAGDLVHTPVPKGVVLFYPKRVKVG